MSFHDDSASTKQNDQSPEAISHWIASCASLANIQQYAVEYKPGRISRKKDNHFSNEIGSSISIYHPMAELATRGVMVERGHIDLDEIDMGWIMSQAIRDETNWHSGNPYNLGKILLFSPIAAAAGYLFSELDRIDDPFEIDSLLEYTDLIIENTTPEDTVNIFKTIVESKLQLGKIMHNPQNSIPDEIERILEDELSLMDMYDYYKQNYVIFDELSKNYHAVSKEGFSAFLEAINEGYTFTEAITHTYITLLSLIPDSDIYYEYGRITAQQLRKDAMEIVEYGGYLTDRGKKMIIEMDTKLDRYDNHLSPKSIDDLTTSTTFLGVLAGIRP